MICTDEECVSGYLDEANTVHCLTCRDNPVARRQPKPLASSGDIQRLVMDDIAARRDFGIVKYGTPLQANNGRDALMDLYQELLDAVCYTRQLIEERGTND